MKRKGRHRGSQDVRSRCHCRFRPRRRTERRCRRRGACHRPRRLEKRVQLDMGGSEECSGVLSVARNLTVAANRRGQLVAGVVNGGRRRREREQAGLLRLWAKVTLGRLGLKERKEKGRERWAACGLGRGRGEKRVSVLLFFFFKTLFWLIL